MGTLRFILRNVKNITEPEAPIVQQSQVNHRDLKLGTNSALFRSSLSLRIWRRGLNSACLNADSFKLKGVFLVKIALKSKLEQCPHHWSYCALSQVSVSWILSDS